MRAHLFGTSPYIPDALFLDGEQLSRATGGNTGNLMFCHSLSRMFDCGPRSIPWGANLTSLNPKEDRLILPLANQLGPHTDLQKLADQFKNIEIPLIGIGLGVQGPITGLDSSTIPAGSWDWLKTVVDHAPTNSPNIALRGEITHKMLSERGYGDACIVSGCPSNFINPSASLGREIYRRRANGVRRVAVAAGNPFLPQFRKLEHSLISLLEHHDGVYVCQHPVDMLRLVKHEYRKIDRKNFHKYRDYIKPSLDDDEFLAWFRRYGYSFSSVPEWLSFMDRFDLVVGTRIHGVMAGIQAGVPSVCLCIDSRTLELCRTMAIPHVDANDYRDGISLEEIQTILRGWDWRHYDATRLMLANRLSMFIRSNGFEPRGAIVDIVKRRLLSDAAYQVKPKNEEVHQLSTASFDDRYKSIFTAIQLEVDVPNPKILSFGCSDGYEPHNLATCHFKHGHIVGCDIDVDAYRIAEMCNQLPSRVTILDSNRDSLEALAPFDVVVANSVLCRWPETKDMEDISSFYPHLKFDDTIAYLVSLLRVGGLLCVYNSNYSIEESSSYPLLHRIENKGLLPASQPVKIFNKFGKPLTAQKVNGILYRKIDERKL